MANRVDNNGFRTLHGTLVCVHEQGILLTGPAGVGKSDCALGLVAAGHQLVADDVVVVSLVGTTLSGSAPPDLEALLSVRDVGVIDVRDVFGTTAFLSKCGIDLQIALQLSEEGYALRPAEQIHAGVRLITIPTSRARNLPLLVETAVKAHLYGGLREIESISTARPS